MNAKDMMNAILAAEWRIKGVSEVSTEPAKIHFTNFYNTQNRWHCELFGVGRYLTFWPLDGNVPNAFWRWMQYLCFGNKWIKEEEK